MKREKRRVIFGRRKALIFTVIFATLTLSVTVGSASGGTPPEEEWNMTYGGTSNDWAEHIQQTSDGGYILAGTTFSYGAGGRDFWLVKTDSNGTKQWDRTFGGTEWDEAGSVQQTTDGGYILAGTTNSYGAGGLDFWLVKTDSNGTKQWDRTFGGTDSDMASSALQTSDGGYILAGTTNSYGAGVYDFWLVKTNSNGTKQWDRTLGGTGLDIATSAQQTSDGGYILAGITNSYCAGGLDFWLVKTDSNGTKQWSKTFSGAAHIAATSVQQTTDGGYILAGIPNSDGADEGDSWLVKTNSNGTKQWDRTFGGTGRDMATHIQQTEDGGYILAGFTRSYGAGEADLWLVKTNSNGTKQWDRTFGGTGSDMATSVQQTTDGGYILAGSTNSYGAGGDDFWLVKIKRE